MTEIYNLSMIKYLHPDVKWLLFSSGGMEATSIDEYAP